MLHHSSKTHIFGILFPLFLKGQFVKFSNLNTTDIKTSTNLGLIMFIDSNHYLRELKQSTKPYFD